MGQGYVGPGSQIAPEDLDSALCSTPWALEVARPSLGRPSLPTKLADAGRFPAPTKAASAAEEPCLPCS